VSYTPLSDSRDSAVGGVIVLYDITTERHQRQQLSVLNRVLRHNLRNEMTVINGFADTVAQRATDDRTEEAAEAITDASDRLLSIARNVRESERIQADSVRQHAVEVDTLIADLQADVDAEYPDAAFSTDVSTDVNPLADSKLLLLALWNLVENAIVHADTAEPSVTLRVTAPDDDRVEFAVLDTNDPIPNIELSSLMAATEEPLQHGIGLGLWTVKRCVDALGGELTFEEANGNAVRITLPAAS
jgi:signal transduction histidine kinase